MGSGIIDSYNKTAQCNTSTKQKKELLKNARKLLKVPITYRELECAQFLVLGYTTSSIARLLNISTRTAEYYINSLKLKCNCDSKWHLSGFLRKRLDIVVNSALDITII